MVDAENRDNWKCFLRHVYTVLFARKAVIFISYRNVALKETMPRVFPDGISHLIFVSF